MLITPDDTIGLDARFFDRAGRSFCVAVCTATFVLDSQRPRLARPEKPRAADEHWDGDPRASLRAAGDLVPYKHGAEVLVVGSCYVPDGASKPTLHARLAIGSVDKTLRVTGPRTRDGSGHIQPPLLFSHVPLRYELAFASDSNPVGVHPPALPQIELARTSGAPSSPHGFGPIAPSWPSRSAVRDREAPEAFNAAPRDQWLEAIVPGDKIILEHLSPLHARIEMEIPAFSPEVTVSRGTGSPETVPMACDTLVVDTDRATLTMVWRGTLNGIPRAKSHEENMERFAHPLPEGTRDFAGSSTFGRGATAPDILLAGSLRRAGFVVDPHAVDTLSLGGAPDDPATLPFESSRKKR